jgi:hypothetical protein
MIRLNLQCVEDRCRSDVSQEAHFRFEGFISLIRGAPAEPDKHNIQVLSYQICELKSRDPPLFPKPGLSYALSCTNATPSTCIEVEGSHHAIPHLEGSRLARFADQQSGRNVKNILGFNSWATHRGPADRSALGPNGSGRE